MGWKDYEFTELDSDDRRSESLHPDVDNESIKDISLSHPSYVSSARLISFCLLFFAIAICSLAVLVVLLTARQAHYSSIWDMASLKLHSGACNTQLRSINIGAHLFINFFGTIILASSNYLQQICSGPDLEEIERQMKTKGDVKFGANSMGSVIRQRSRSMMVIWFSLVFTSLPIHVMINGIFGYAVYNEAPINGYAGLASQYPEPPGSTNITATVCQNYLLSSLAYITDYDNMTVILKNNDNVFDYELYAGGESYGSTFLPSANDIVSCYIHQVESQCELTVRWFPLVCTALAVTIKSLIAFISLRRHSHFRKRLFNSLGDMITIGARHRHLLPPMDPCAKYPFVSKSGAGMFGGPYRPKKVRWVKTLGWADLGVATFWWVSVLGVTIGGTLAWLSVGQGLSFMDRFKRFGLGTIDPSTSFVPGAGMDEKVEASEFAILVIVANSPQIWLSFGYLLWNNQITRIWMEHEWRSYYRRHQKPRVSYITHEPNVRGTRWLQLPYWATATLMIINTTLHWLVSQTMFVVEILGSKDDSPSSTYYINYSPLAIMSIGIASSVLVLGITIYYFVPQKVRMPLMGGSARMVFESCKGLPRRLPGDGVAWGDISTLTKYRAGFGESVGSLIVGVIYPSKRVDGDIRDEISEITVGGDSDTEYLIGRGSRYYFR